MKYVSLYRKQLMLLSCILLLSVPTRANAETEIADLKADAKKLAGLTENIFDTVKKESLFGLSKITAFEEHPSFVYILGPVVQGNKKSSITRRIFLLKPGIAHIEDSSTDGSRKGFQANTFKCSDKTEYRSGDTFIVDTKPYPYKYQIEDNLHKFTLILPNPRHGAGTIQITKKDGTVVLPERPLPSGILPHTPAGIKLLANWDKAYHDNKRPGWDTGRAASELKKFVQGEKKKKGRALVLGCGTGTNAIYLAQQGYDVTGIDIAPTALSRAAAKAKKAKVKVHWLLADVLNTPDLKAFDFIFDRGCYHGVRRHNAKGFVKTLKKVSHPGTQALIIAGNANEERHYGPPRVKEEEIRGDFTKDFKFAELRETRFDSANETAKGPLAWAILLERKAGKEK